MISEKIAVLALWTRRLALSCSPSRLSLSISLEWNITYIVLHDFSHNILKVLVVKVNAIFFVTK